MNLTFRKTGKEIKVALQNRKRQLQQRLEKRNQVLSEFLKDIGKVRSYLVRGSSPNWGHGTRGYVLYSQEDISSEEQQEIAQLCQRIFEIEQELYRLELVAAHLDDQQLFDLSFEELVGYGFNTGLESSMQ